MFVGSTPFGVRSRNFLCDGLDVLVQKPRVGKQRIASSADTVWLAMLALPRIAQALGVVLQNFGGRLFAWPVQADAIVGVAWQHVQMEVKDGLFAFFAIGL